MTPFDHLPAITAPIAMANIDADKTFPAQYLKTIQREGLGKFLFASMRKDPDFVLNRAPWCEAGILVTLGNFGCGSSREHAPWALLDFGTRCIVAPSFADIFYNNCLKNGILPVVLPAGAVDTLLHLCAIAEAASTTVDLPSQTLIAANGFKAAFDIDPRSKTRLLSGEDDITRALGMAGAISKFERRIEESRPWLVSPPGLPEMVERDG